MSPVVEEGANILDATTFKFHEKSTAIGMNNNELSAKYVIICPVMKENDEGYYEMRSEDFNYIQKWVDDSRAALEAGDLVAVDIKEAEKDARRAKKRKRNDSDEEEKEYSSAGAKTRGGRTVKPRKK